MLEVLDMPYSYQYTPCPETVWSIVYAQPRWQTSDPPGFEHIISEFRVTTGANEAELITYYVYGRQVQTSEVDSHRKRVQYV